MTATMKKIIRTKALISQMPDIVEYQAIEKKLSRDGIYSMLFYYFVYSGGLEKIKHGVYKKTALFDKLNVDEVIEKANLVLSQKRVNRIKTKEQKSAPYILESSALEFNDDAEMIRHLKAKGYRVMKPVNQWEEL